MTNIGTIFTASFAGDYSFFMFADDNAHLYISNQSFGIDEVLISNGARYTASYYDYLGQISEPIYLSANQTIFMRIVWENTYRADALKLAVKIDPDANIYYLNEFSGDSLLNNVFNDSFNSNMTSNYLNKPEISSTMYTYNNFPDIQSIKLTYSHFYEQQVITINNAVDGKFALILQKQFVTRYFNLSVSGVYIANILTKTLQNLPKDKVQVRNFETTITKFNNSISISVQFVTDTYRGNATLLQVVTSYLIGDNVNAYVKR